VNLALENAQLKTGPIDTAAIGSFARRLDQLQKRVSAVFGVLSAVSGRVETLTSLLSRHERDEPVRVPGLDSTEAASNCV
jgi:hypothetical protein